MHFTKHFRWVARADVPEITPDMLAKFKPNNVAPVQEHASETGMIFSALVFSTGH